MRDAEKTIGNMIDKQSVCYISSIDKEGFPNTAVDLMKIGNNIMNKTFQKNYLIMPLSMTRLVEK